jgi:hypothetical protein
MKSDLIRNQIGSKFFMIMTRTKNQSQDQFTSNFLVGEMSKHSLCCYFWCSPSKAWCKPMIKLKKAPRYMVNCNGIYSCTYTWQKVGLGIFANAKNGSCTKTMRLGLCMVPGFSAPTYLQPKVWTTMKGKRAYPPLYVLKNLTLTNLFFGTCTPLHVFKELTSTKNVLVCCAYYVPRTYYLQVLGWSGFSGLGVVKRVIIDKYMYNPWHIRFSNLETRFKP